MEPDLIKLNEHEIYASRHGKIFRYYQGEYRKKTIKRKGKYPVMRYKVNGERKELHIIKAVWNGFYPENPINSGKDLIFKDNDPYNFALANMELKPKKEPVKTNSKRDTRTLVKLLEIQTQFNKVACVLPRESKKIRFHCEYCGFTNVMKEDYFKKMLKNKDNKSNTCFNCEKSKKLNEFFYALDMIRAKWGFTVIPLDVAYLYKKHAENNDQMAMLVLESGRIIDVTRSWIRHMWNHQYREGFEFTAHLNSRAATFEEIVHVLRQDKIHQPYEKYATFRSELELEKQKHYKEVQDNE